tara:strand:- start:759 stop:1082 length:324 start_codon:yes stop_codon:yes gene_type:complete
MADANNIETEEKSNTLNITDDKGVVTKYEVSTFSDEGKVLFQELAMVEQKLTNTNARYMEALVDLKIQTNAKQQYLANILEVEKLNESEEKGNEESKEPKEESKKAN